MPVLARAIEAAGISTVLVTLMPFWSEKLGTPRTLAVEYPFGHQLGHAGEREEQIAVIRRALRMLREAKTPGALEHFEQPWPGDAKEWRRRWQPAEPAPLIKMLLEAAQKQAQERREGDAPA